MSIGKRREQGLALRSLTRTTGYPRQQVTRLMRQFRDRGAIAKRYRPPATGLPSRITSVMTATTDVVISLKSKTALPGVELIGTAVSRIGTMRTI